MALADPGSVGVDPRRLEEYERQMRAAVRGSLMAGCASVVLRRGQAVQTGCYGLADLDTRASFRLDTICRVYCMTKPYVAFALMSLVDEGRVRVQDAVAKYLPCFRQARVVASSGGSVRPKRAMTVEHLLLHMSGIGYSAGFGQPPEGDAQLSYAPLMDSVASGRVRTLESFVQRLAKLPLRFHPGDDYEYGFSIDVLARVVEVVSGKSIEDCLRERVFAPLGMDDTGYTVAKAKLHRLAACYGSARIWGNLYGDIPGEVPVTTRQGLVRVDGSRAELSAWAEGRECSIRGGGGWMAHNQGGLVSTTADTVRFVRMLLKHGVTEDGVRLLRRETLLSMERPSRMAAALGKRECFFGHIGGYVDGKEFGQGGHASTFWSLDRTDSVAVVWFAQHLDFWEWNARVVDPEKADIWRVMREAVRAGKCMRAATGRGGSARAAPGRGRKRRRSPNLA